MSISRAQSTTTGAGVTTLAYGSNVTSGNLLVIGAASAFSSTVITVSKSSGTATVGAFSKYSGRTFLAGAGGSEIWWALVTGSGSLTILFSFSGGGASSCDAHIREYSSTLGWPATPTDAQASTTGNSTTPNSGNIATSGTSDLLVAVCSGGSSTNYTAGSGYGDIQTSSFKMGSEDELNVTAGTYSGAFSGSSAVWTCCVAAFKENATGGGLFLPSQLSGLGAGGPFFGNPL